MTTQADTTDAVPMTRAEMTFDFDGLIQLLAGHLYSEKKVFIRELIQNGHDAIVRRAHEDQAFDRDQGRIHVLTDLTAEPGRIIFRDNGLGMSAPTWSASCPRWAGPAPAPRPAMHRTSSASSASASCPASSSVPA